MLHKLDWCPKGDQDWYPKFIVHTISLSWGRTDIRGAQTPQETVGVQLPAFHILFVLNIARRQSEVR